MSELCIQLSTMAVHKVVLVILIYLGLTIAEETEYEQNRVFAKPLNADMTLDCGIKELAWEYAKKLLPRYGNSSVVYDTLQLKACGVSLASGKTYTPESCKYKAAAIKEDWLNDPDISVYVDPVKGNDNNPGTSDKPMKTIEAAVRVYRYKKTSKTDQGLISLAAGTYFLTNTINLTAEDSNLVILGESSDNTIICGGKQYTFDWKTFPMYARGAIGGQQANIVVADLSSQDPIPFTALFLNGRRAVRARYPNGNPETTGLHTNPTGYVSSAERWLPAASKPNASTIQLDTPQRNETYFAQFHINYGGPADVFDPQESYWGDVFKTPSGLVYSSKEGINGFLMHNCRFDSPGGNALFLSNYVRNAVIEANEFIYTGDSAIAAIGSAQLIDATNGNQPRGTKILCNLVHEIGIYGKQVSAYTQSLACQTEIIGNVFFNGPRAGINFNDGFGGGNQIKNNLVFNMVRETRDHGPFNSWDRQPYLTRVKDGKTPSLEPVISNITRNFMINSYNSTWLLDHDDGSSYYHNTFNYLIYGGFKNIHGHSKVAMFNVYVHPDLSNDFKYCATSDRTSTGQYASGWGDIWANNTCYVKP